MAYNYYTGSELLTNKAAVAPSSNSDYTYPKKSPFNMKLAEEGFLSADENIPNFITPYTTDDSEDYGCWGKLYTYKVAGDQFYYKDGDDYTPYKFVDKYSAPILNKGNDNTNYTYSFETFDIKDYSGDDTQSPPYSLYYTLSWDSKKKIKLQTYDNRSTSPISTESMDGYGCFILLSGGGGGGGGWFGGGGGGGATALMYIDLYNLSKELSNGFITISLGKGGTGGVATTENDKHELVGGNGSNGGPSSLYVYENNEDFKETLYVISISCGGGGYGYGGNGNMSDVSGGAGGSVTARSAERSADGTITGSTSTELTKLPSYIKVLTPISGGSGGRGGRDENGSSVENTTYSIPFDFTWETPTTVIGQGSPSLGSSGGGGASALSIDSAGYGQGGTGGDEASAGQAGSGGRLIIFKNYFC